MSGNFADVCFRRAAVYQSHIRDFSPLSPFFPAGGSPVTPVS
jgi:hypothetical protein